MTEIFKTYGDPDKLEVKRRRMKALVHTGFIAFLADKREMCLNISFILRERHTRMGRSINYNQIKGKCYCIF